MEEFVKLDAEISEDDKVILVSKLLASILHPATLSVMNDSPELSFKDRIYEALINEGILRLLLQNKVKRLGLSEKV